MSQDKDLDHFVKTKTQDFCTKIQTKTFFQVLQSPREQDHVLEDCITGVGSGLVVVLVVVVLVVVVVVVLMVVVTDCPIFGCMNRMPTSSSSAVS